jgi:hypothetical protein
MSDTNGPARTTLLSGLHTESEIKKLLESSSQIRAAVAYWGADAMEQLGIEGLAGRDVIIICDLMSGACNPDEIERLQKYLGRQRVLMRDNLHAKVWLTEKGAIVGSSNASANGLGFERAELRGSIEANLLPTILQC